MSKVNLTEHEEIRIWSDGGKKHFKQTGMMRFVSELQETLRERSITIQYNFFASYHGHKTLQ